MVCITALIFCFLLTLSSINVIVLILNVLMHHSSRCIRLITLVLLRAVSPFITLPVLAPHTANRLQGKHSPSGSDRSEKESKLSLANAISFKGNAINVLRLGSDSTCCQRCSPLSQTPTAPAVLTIAHYSTPLSEGHGRTEHLWWAHDWQYIPALCSQRCPILCSR